MRKFTRLAAAAASIVIPFLSIPAHADVYRCVRDDGHISYQQIACSFESKPVRLEKRSSGWTPLRPGEKHLLNRYRNSEAGQRNRSVTRQPKEPARETKTCWNMRKQLEAVSSKLHRGYKLKEGRELRRKRANYQDYLRQFCS